ncbi:NADP-dependent oxidoreductase [Pectobacterium carotovorum]|uniref:NADP-dependent oxidoreductase n=1 Tax=Pectobacterium carotovorum TaxID=554 RepID=UPI0029D427BC|nr:NADP-dependent oxidoreductase [Pectobacterium carotovorum]MDX6916294.1 NADP-dependent oxidoreductase [Pectobacterium carotovorum]
MKALVLKSYGKDAHVDFATIPRPEIKDHEILVKIHAVGLNPIDYMIPEGTFKPILRFTLPAVIGSDLAGTVVETGSKVTRFRAGDAVYASIFDMDNGSLSEYVAVPENAAALKPEILSFTEAASLPMVALTVWQAFERVGVCAGQKVFIPAGSGGIGTFAIQLARHLGASVATTTSTRNTGLVKSLGAQHVIDYTYQDFEKELSGYDMVIGTVRGNSLEKAMRIIRPGGQLVSLVGPVDLPFARQRKMNPVMKALFWLMSCKINVLAMHHQVRYAFHFMHPDGARLAEIAALVDAGKLIPVIDRVFTFDETLNALSYLKAGHAKGKVVVAFPRES